MEKSTDLVALAQQYKLIEQACWLRLEQALAAASRRLPCPYKQPRREAWAQRVECLKALYDAEWKKRGYKRSP